MRDMKYGCTYKLNDNFIVFKYLFLLFCHDEMGILGQQRLLFLVSLCIILKWEIF